MTSTTAPLLVPPPSPAFVPLAAPSRGCEWLPGAEGHVVAPPTDLRWFALVFTKAAQLAAPAAGNPAESRRPAR